MALNDQLRGTSIEDARMERVVSFLSLHNCARSGDCGAQRREQIFVYGQEAN